MASRLISWSKGRQSAAEPYHRTGGLLPIDTFMGDSTKEVYPAHTPQKTPTTQKSGKRRPPALNLSIPADLHPQVNCFTPASARQNAAAHAPHSAADLLAAVSDMLRSPALSAAACPQSAGIHKPLPRPPTFAAVSSPPAPPVELPGSILLENQGFPPPFDADPDTDTATQRASIMKSTRSGTSYNSNAASVKPIPSRVPQHKKSLSEAALHRRSKSKANLITSPSSTDSKLTAYSVSTNGGNTSSNESTKARVGVEKVLQPSPVIVEGKPMKHVGTDKSNRQDELGTPPTPTPVRTRNKEIDELKATITAQDNTISTLQSQFGSLRASHEAHVASLVDAHAAEIASLKNYTRVLEEQQSQRTLHHASSNHLLLFLDPSEPQTPTKESPDNTAGSASATSIRSFKSAFEQPVRSPHPLRQSPEMETFKRKLSVARRPETGNRDLIRENQQYKVNNAALQRQIESLMTKLNQSKTNERNLTVTLEKVEKNCNEWQEKASKAEQLEKSTLALQNTVDHLEHRLEMANAEKLDAEEQILNLQSGRSPFDPVPPRLRIPEQPTEQANRQTAHMSMSTVFSSGSPAGHSPEVQESSTLAAFISHIERLQEQIKQKDTTITELEQEIGRLRRKMERLEREHRESNLQLDIQSQLLTKTAETDAHIEQLRSAIIDREFTIGEKEKALRMAERQLEHHKLLLHAEIRRHATMSMFACTEEDPLPELSSLASKEDIDRWIARLQARLNKEQPKDTQTPQTQAQNDLDARVKDLQREIDFYVREIIYYKLDVKGYKSDIKKLKHFAARIGSYGGRTSDVESPTPSVVTPSRLRFSSGTPGPGIASTPSPISTGPISASVSIGRPITPPGANPLTPDPSPADTIKPTIPSQTRPLHEPTPITPRTPPFRTGINVANEADNIDPGVSPRSVARLSPERRKPTPPSPEQEKFGDMATNFPLGTPAAPKRHDTQRSMSESIIQLYSTSRTPERSPNVITSGTPSADDENVVVSRKRSASVPEPSKGKATPERPPRPRFGLYETSTAGAEAAGPRSPPRKDVMAEALRNSPSGAPPTEPKLSTDDGPTNASDSTLRGLPNGPRSRGNLSGSATAIPAPLALRSRAGSGASSTGAPGSPPRKLSSSSSNMPFIIGMPSPHNPALISPTLSVPPTTCSITGKCANMSPTTALPPSAMKLNSPTSRIGVGGTMASSTPVTSPNEIPEALAAAKHGHGYFPSSLPLAKSSGAGSGTANGHAASRSVSSPTTQAATTAATTGTHIRNASLSAFPPPPATNSTSNTATRMMSLSMPSRKDRDATTNTNTSTSENRPHTPTTTDPTTGGAGTKSPGHSRTVSASSIRSAMQIPSALMKGKGRARKECISKPILQPGLGDGGFEAANEGVQVGRAF